VRTRRQGTQICYAAVPEAVAELTGELVGLRPRPQVKAA
jgi:hypothetical protein